MLDLAKSLPEDPEDLRRITALLLAEVKSQALLIAKLRHQLAGHRNHRFGTSSETIEQRQLALEASEIAIAKMTAKLQPADEEPKDTPKRRPIPDHIPRMEFELTTGDADCAQCGGALRRLGEDVTEELEYVPGRFSAPRIVRPRFTCTGCEAFTQAPLPSRPIERGRPGPGLLAHVLLTNTPITCRSIAKARSSSVTGWIFAARRWRTGARPGRAAIEPSGGRIEGLSARSAGRQIDGSAGAAGRCHRAARGGRTGDLRGRHSRANAGARRRQDRDGAAVGLWPRRTAVAPKVRLRRNGRRRPASAPLAVCLQTAAGQRMSC